MRGQDFAARISLTLKSKIFLDRVKRRLQAFTLYVGSFIWPGTLARRPLPLRWGLTRREREPLVLSGGHRKRMSVTEGSAFSPARVRGEPGNSSTVTASLNGRVEVAGLIHHPSPHGRVRTSNTPLVPPERLQKDRHDRHHRHMLEMSLVL